MLGASGFVGAAVVAFGRSNGADITPVALPRISLVALPHLALGSLDGAAEQWCRANRGAFEDLCRALAPFDVVINAAGDARASARTVRDLVAANAVLPAVVVRAAQRAGVRRLVHISSAAVQGRLDPLDETARHQPLSPYATSKAQGERVLLGADPSHGPACFELIVYRPTSIHAAGQLATRSLSRMLRRLPLVPVVRSGPSAWEQPLPVVQLDNVAAGILFAATMLEAAPIVLQPDEAMTARRLLTLFGAHRFVPVPSGVAKAAIEQVGHLTHRSPYLTSRVRWLELLVRGQSTEAKVLAAAGFAAPTGTEGWEALAKEMRVAR